MSGRRVIGIVIYLLLMAALVGGMFVARDRALAAMGTPEAIAEWRQWKAATEEAAKRQEPVKRRVVKANEPPVLLLFRDHFVVITVSLAIVASLLYFFLAMTMTGMAGGRGAVARGDDVVEGGDETRQKEGESG